MSALDLFDATPWRLEPQSSAIGMTVRLARDIDRQKPCCDNVAIVHPGKPPHAAELRCAGCGAYRGWLPQSTLNFIVEMTAWFGTPPEPIIVRQQHKENEMAFQQKPNRGSLFRNDDKSKDEDRDYAGSINVEGREFWLSGWINETKAGNKYLSLSIKSKDEQSRDKAKPKGNAARELNDAIPF